MSTSNPVGSLMRSDHDTAVLAAVDSGPSFAGAVDDCSKPTDDPVLAAVAAYHLPAEAGDGLARYAAVGGYGGNGYAGNGGYGNGGYGGNGGGGVTGLGVAAPPVNPVMAQASALHADKPGTRLTDANAQGYRLEALDANHRMGNYLAAAYDEYEGLNLDRDFFGWVQETIDKDQRAAAERWNAGLFSGIDGIRDEKKRNALKDKCFEWFKQGVKYLDNEVKRGRYMVTIDEAGGMSRKVTGKGDAVDKFDSESLVDKFKARHGGLVGKNCIFVMDPDGNFYSHVSKVTRMHHSSFLGGENVQAAGEWKVQGGKLKEIEGTTGHYRVPTEGFVKAVKALEAKGALQPDTVVKLYPKHGGQPVSVNAREFARAPEAHLKDNNTFSSAHNQ